MADPFVAEIRIFPFNFAPKGWAWCDGQLLPLSQNTALFSLLGTTYGGDGKSNFALPDLQGRAPMHPGQGPGLSLHDLGETGGSETVTLLESEIPSHSHALMATVPTPAQRQAPAVLARCSIRRRERCTSSRRTPRWSPWPNVAGAGRRRPAAQQPAAVPDVLLLHRAAGRVPAGADRRRDHRRGRSSITLRPDGPGRPLVPPRGLRQHARARARRGASGTPRRRPPSSRCSSTRSTRHYQEHYAGAAFDVILVDGQPAGRLYVAREEDEIRIVDIALLPEYRNRGIGTTLLRGLQSEAAAAGKPLRIHVERFNPALRLYERLGFRRSTDRGVYLFMEWTGG